MNTERVKDENAAPRPHVFVVNSSADFLTIIRELLQDEHYTVTTTNFAPETFAQLTATGPDLVVVDLAVGQPAGTHLLARLQTDAATRPIPVVVVSTDPRLLEQARAETPPEATRRYLRKPLDLETLLGTIHDLLALA